MSEGPEKDEKTEDATPRRLEDAREKGEVAFSSELMAAATLVGGLLAFAITGPNLAETAGSSVAGGVRRVGDLAMAELSLEDFANLLAGTLRGILPQVMRLVFPVVIAAAVVGFVQVGGLRMAPQAIGVKWSKLNPVAGAKRLFGAKSWMRTGLALLKLTALGVTLVVVSWEDVVHVGKLAGGDLGPALVAIGRIVSRAAVAGVIVITLLALFDLWFQRAQHAKEMKMSKKELRDEHKSSEGDPMVKARIRQVQREVAGQRMMEEVPNATVVVTNPTHFAVALRYTSEEGGAPRVVAKGVDEIARKIKDVAREAGVLVYEDPPLARALHRGCQIGDEVPEELFQAVAGVLAYVYRVQGGAPQPA
jgi:flagellar biosynthesis protein FlhB